MTDPTAASLQPVVRKIGQREIVFDNEGFLSDFHDWNEEICLLLAQESGLAALDERHWRVLQFLRDFYASNGRAPLNNQLKKGTAMTLLELESLFPGGIKLGPDFLRACPTQRPATRMSR